MKMSCKYCGIVEKPHKCPHKIKRKTNRYRIDTRHYEGNAYKKARETALIDCDKLCLWSFYIYGELVTAEETHHIIEILEDESKASDPNNLIPLTEENHELVHQLYKRSELSKERTKELLFNMINDYKKGDLTLKKYRKEINKL